jgi:CRP-like cAMP-binding protein
MERLSVLAEKIGITFDEGGVVFRQGEPGDKMYIIHQGSVAVIREKNGAGTVVARLGTGDFFGEMALVDRGPRSATVKAIERTTLVPVTRDFLLKHSSRDTRFILTVIESLGRRLEKVDEMLRWRFADSGTPPEPAMDEGIAEPRSAAFLKSFSSLAGSSATVRFRKGDVIFEQGAPGDRMFIILDGEIEISQEAGESRMVRARFGRGHFFGEMALFSGHARTATARVVVDAVLLPIDRETFLGKIQSDPEVAFHTVQVLIVRLRKSLQALR